jgi:WD40 repeat protein
MKSYLSVGLLAAWVCCSPSPMAADEKPLCHEENDYQDEADLKPFLRDRQERATLAREDDKVTFTIAFSSDGTLMATTHDNCLRVWNVKTGKEQLLFEAACRCPMFVALSPDGKSISTVNDENPLPGKVTVRHWDVAGKREKSNYTLKAIGNSALSPDGKVLAVAGPFEDRTAVLIDLMSGKEMALLEGHTKYVTRLAFSLDGKMLATGCRDGTVCLWDVQEKKRLAAFHAQPLGKWIQGLAFTPDGKRLVVCGDGYVIRVYDVMAQKYLLSFHSIVNGADSLAVSPDGKLLAVGGGWPSRACVL